MTSEPEGVVYIDRPRLEAAFSAAACKPVTVVCAPSGAGKTTAIGAYIERCPGRGVHYVADRQAQTLVTFARGLADELAPSLPALSHGLAAAAANAAATQRPAMNLANWFADHLGKQPIAVALDDLHLIDDCQPIVEFIVRAIERSADNVRWILGLRSTFAFPVASWLAGELADFQIDGATLAFTSDEAAALRERIGGTIASYGDVRGGHVGGLILSFLGQPAPDGTEFEKAVEQAGTALVQSLPPQQMCALHALLNLPHLEDRLVECIPHGRELCERMQDEAPYALWVSRRPHFTRTFEAVVDRIDSADEPLRGEGARLAIAALEEHNAPRRALRVAVRARASADVLALLERHGFALADGGYGDILAEALDAVPAALRGTSFATVALEAMRESDLGRHDLADSWFAHAADLATDAGARFRIQYIYAGNLLRRGRLDCIGILEHLSGEPSTPELEAAVIGTLAAAYSAAGRLQEARSQIDRALARLDGIGDVVTRASVYQNAAYVALAEHDVDAAERYADVALSLSDEHGLDRIAVLAHSVRYVVASSYRDDVDAAIRAIEALEICAKRSSNATFRRYALLGLIESYSERGDRSELERTERQLAAEEIENDVEHVEEALVPSRAMRLAWSGDFVAAYRLLASSAERQMNPDQRATRWSEMAVYAAAAELDDEARGAISVARLGLRRTALSGAAGVRARLNLALAFLLLGRLRPAAGLLSGCERTAAPLPRLRKFHALLRVLLERRRGSPSDAEILRLLEAMEDAGFGGVSRTIEAVSDARLGHLESAA